MLLTVYNPTAGTVVVTGVQFFFQRLDRIHPTPSAAAMVAPVGLGATVAVPTLGTITIGPTYLAVGSAAAYTTATNPQPSQPQTYVLMVGAYVRASDGSVNIALPVAVQVTPWEAPSATYQDGDLNWSYGQNMLFNVVLGVL